MLRPRPNEPTARRALVGATLLLVLIPFLPPRFTRWAAGFGQVTRLLIAPISHPVDAVAGRLSVRAGEPPEPELVLQLEAESDRFELLYRQEIARSQRLQRLVEDLQEGIKLGEDPSMRLVTATVVGRSSDLASQLLEVRAGTNKGVTRNTTATVHGAQLLGQVVRTGVLTSWVQPITAPGARPLQGRVILDDPQRILRCNLAPTPSGSLAGRLSFLLDEQTQEPVIPEIGATVRLDDDLWPANAQMLLIGTVDRVAPYENEPSRWQVTVRPRLALDQIRGEVTLRVTTDPASVPAPGGGAP
jgi:hypothetical protein